MDECGSSHFLPRLSILDTPTFYPSAHYTPTISNHAHTQAGHATNSSPASSLSFSYSSLPFLPRRDMDVVAPLPVAMDTLSNNEDTSTCVSPNNIINNNNNNSNNNNVESFFMKNILQTADQQLGQSTEDDLSCMYTPYSDPGYMVAPPASYPSVDSAFFSPGYGFSASDAMGSGYPAAPGSTMTYEPSALVADYYPGHHQLPAAYCGGVPPEMPGAGYPGTHVSYAATPVQTPSRVNCLPRSPQSAYLSSHPAFRENEATTCRSLGHTLDHTLDQRDEYPQQPAPAFISLPGCSPEMPGKSIFIFNHATYTNAQKHIHVCGCTHIHTVLKLM